MEIVPQLLIKGRKILSQAHAPQDLSRLASELSERFKHVYVTDIDGVEKNKPQLDVVREICDEIPTLYEGGVRFSSNVIDMLITGAEKAVVGSATLVSLEELRGAFKLSENIIFKADYRDGIVSFDPQISGRAFLPLAKELADIGVREIVVPRKLAREAVAAKEKYGLTLGVFGEVSERATYEPLGVDYMIARDYGGLDGHE
ncbi:MAG: HisA/HisF-related TIM barrel protein [Thermoplasmata archaeon]